ncbi:hypothetical protein NRIC_17970 [Enterococcus florum]|uniref:Uncharacterized protein n=1 Tax=Enterococcus florum TaxID=2480627 RepID=A0A4P5P8P2_9ENTE|nr:hypothetical protein [Enterococcus florum]GCF93906.1 hypothetical protein NRIC_17970 [Enterococcus florum]
MRILISVAVVLSLGAIFGIVFGVAAKKDPRILRFQDKELNA